VRAATILASILALGAIAAPAHADDWWKGPRGRTRILHGAIAATAGVAYLTSEIEKSNLAPEHCRWCNPPSFDVSVRNAILWGNPGRAVTLSTLSGYVMAPTLGYGLLGIASLSRDDASFGQFLDDLVPVLETVAISQVGTNIVKFTVGRQRPYAHFATSPRDADDDDNLSFFSGHSALTFAIATGSGLVAHWRHYKVEPVLWVSGLSLAAVTAYFRMAGDKHYLSDVVTGSTVGVVSGLTIPRLMEHDVAVVPTPGGAAVVGSF
jgi:membrane-associated phospholipid phosphatase